MAEDEKRIIVKIHFKPEDGAVFDHLNRTPQKHRNWEIKKLALHYFNGNSPALSEGKQASSVPGPSDEATGRRSEDLPEDSEFETF